MINNGHFQVFFRRRQNQANYPGPDDPLINVIVVGDPLTGEAKYLPGDVDNTTPYKNIVPVGGWYDFSNYIEDTEGSTFTWDKVNQGDSKNSETSKTGSNYDKGISANLFLFDKGFQFVYDWLVLFDYQIVNCVEVKIIDLVARAKKPDPAGNYRIFEIKNDNLDYAPIDEPCEFHVKLREQDLIWHCIHKTIIHDDWQKWFNEDGTSTKEHPTFLSCIEPRPRLVQSARMALMMFFHGIKTGFFPIAILIDWITDAPSPREDARRIMNANRFIEAPFIHTLIENVALKCGMTTDTIFDTGREWERLCCLFPRGGEMHESEDDAIASPAQTFHWGNRWLITVPDILDKLKVVFCAEWYVTPQNKIVFAYLKDLLKLDPIYDFTLAGSVPFYNLRYTFNGDKKPAYGEYRYSIDPVDEASQEVNPLYSDTIGFDQASNPMLEGEVQKNFEFAPTGFVRDGRAKDYMKLLIHDGEFGALILVAIIAIITAAVIFSNISIVTIPLTFALGAFLFATATAIAAQANKFKDDFLNNDIYTGAVRLTAEQTTVPRLLLWDGVQTDRAKVVRRTGLPVIYPYYNRPTALYPGGVPYNVRNIIDKDNPSALIFNYPLYFDGFYYDNMFPKYHDMIDNPLKSKESHQTAKFDVDLCEDMQNLFGFFEDQYAQIGKIVKLETRDNYDVYVKISNLFEDYPAGLIHITGQVIKRPVGNVTFPDDQNPGNLPVPVPEGPGDPTPPPIGQTCFRWINGGTEASLVSYHDCDGNLISAESIDPGNHFCALDIVFASPNTIYGSATCDDPLPDPTTCSKYINFSDVCAENVSYIDCNNEVVTGATVCFMETICAIEILDPGTPCSNLVNVGLCDPCEPPCCTPSIISVSTGDCVPIGVNEFTIPDGAIGVPYEYRQSLDTDGATPPFDITVIDAPSWMTITIDPDTNEIVFAGTPDALGESPVNFNISNCAGLGFLEAGTFIFIGSDATANAGDDQEICFTDTVTLSGSIGGSADSQQWTTDGDGTFDDDTSLTAVYTPGAGDISFGGATLTLTAFVSAVPTAIDTMNVIIDAAAIATFDYEVPNPGHNYCQCTPENPACIGNPISPNFTGGGIPGIFTATAGLLFFDTGSSPSPTGQVDIANTPPGTYTVTNTVNNECGSDVDTADIIILADCVRTISYPPGTFTTGDSPQSVTVTGGSMILPSYSAEAGLTINGSTGQITPATSTPGTYNVFVFFFCPTFGSCPSSATTIVIIT